MRKRQELLTIENYEEWKKGVQVEFASTSTARGRLVMSVSLDGEFLVKIEKKELYRGTSAEIAIESYNDNA